MASDDLRSWLENMHALGYGEAEIRQSLRDKGWSEGQIDGMLAPSTAATVAPAVPPAVTQLPPPPPVPQGPLTPQVAYTPTAQGPPAVAPAGGSGLAVAALVMGLLAVLLFPTAIITAPLAIIFGVVSLSKRRAGQGMAIAGLVMAGIGLLLLPFWAIMAASWFSVRSATTSVIPKQETPSDEQPATPEGSQGEDTNGETPGATNTASEGDDAMCLSHERALMAAMRMYTHDNGTALPDAASWPVGLHPYLPAGAEAWHCPADQRAPQQSAGGISTSYTMYEDMGGTYLNSFSEKNLAQAYVLFDGTEIGAGETAGDFRHHGGLNLGYADGHCAWVEKQTFLHPPTD